MIRSEAEIVITPTGPFSWATTLDVLARWEPVRRHRRGDSAVTRLAFPPDGDFTPVAVALRDDGGTLYGEVAGTQRLDAIAAQVARIFSLDHDGTSYGVARAALDGLLDADRLRGLVAGVAGREGAIRQQAAWVGPRPAGGDGGRRGRTSEVSQGPGRARGRPGRPSE